MQPIQITEKNTLQRTLGPLMLWGLGVGYVISGMYFGWNLGLPAGGTLGLAIATFFIIILYITFTFSYTELACAIPKAGGVFDYAGRAMGREMGFIAGVAQIIEFVFAPPALAHMRFGRRVCTSARTGDRRFYSVGYCERSGCMVGVMRRYSGV